MVHLLVLNPNSSSSITRSLEALLGRSPTPGVRLSFLTGPEGEAPQAIDDEASAERSAKACKRMLDEEERELAGQVDGVLVCCCESGALGAAAHWRTTDSGRPRSRTVADR
jgi:Asp/Glu/hydantoin racemase